MTSSRLLPSDDTNLRQVGFRLKRSIAGVSHRTDIFCTENSSFVSKQCEADLLQRLCSHRNTHLVNSYCSYQLQTRTAPPQSGAPCCNIHKFTTVSIVVNVARRFCLSSSFDVSFLFFYCLHLVTSYSYTLMP